jgi:hypothetical protein
VKAHAAILVLLAATASAQVSPRPPEAVVPVVGSTEGQANAHFKTELQLSNPAGNVAAGFLVLRPQGIALRYELAPHATLAFEDVVAEIGATGLASLDVLVDRGSLPVVVARAYDDQPGGTTGLSVPLIAATTPAHSSRRATSPASASTSASARSTSEQRSSSRSTTRPARNVRRAT